MKSIWLFLGLFLSVCNSVPTVPITGTTIPPGCYSNGNFYPEGASYNPSACKHCYCNQGREVCAIGDCFFTPCVDSVHKPDVCCPVCPNGNNCWAGKQIIPAGKDVKIDDHTTCRCPEGGHMFGSHGNHAYCTIKMDPITVIPVAIP